LKGKKVPFILGEGYRSVERKKRVRKKTGQKKRGVREKKKDRFLRGQLLKSAGGETAGMTRKEKRHEARGEPGTGRKKRERLPPG